MAHSLVTSIFQYIGGLCIFAFGCFMLLAPTLIADVALQNAVLQEDKKEGTVYIHIIKQQGDKVLLQPLVPATLGFILDNGDLAGQKFLECEQWRVIKEIRNVQYPVLQLRCSGIVMSLEDVLMTEK